LRREGGSVDVVAHRFSARSANPEEGQVRAVALDVHRDVCEVAIVAEGRLRSGGRIAGRRLSCSRRASMRVIVWRLR
jgi:hypothetical protein